MGACSVHIVSSRESTPMTNVFFRLSKSTALQIQSCRDPTEPASEALNGFTFQMCEFMMLPSLSELMFL